jgi:hypothetical protein
MVDLPNNMCKNMNMGQSDTATVKSRMTKSIFKLISIILVNLFLMLIAFKTGLSITDLIWLYWCEGVIIGLIQLLKVFTVESTSATVIEYLRSDEPPIGLTICFLCLEVPLHGFFAIWIYRIDPTFDYVHGLLMMGGVIIAYEFFYYIRDSRPWREPDDFKNVIIESGIYLVRFIPVLALYHFMVKTQAGEGNMTLLTVEFMLFKLVSDVISHCIKKYLLKNETS